MNLTARFFALACLIILGVYARGIDLATHFTHVDDVGVARTILAFQQAEPLQADQMAYRLYEDQSQNALTRFVSKLVGATGKSPWGLGLANGIYRVSAVPAAWTYAPLQFIFTYFLISPMQSYREILFWGRLPSFLFGVLALFCAVLFYRKFDPAKSPAVFLALAMLSLSWESIVYAKQMQCYSAGIFAAMAVQVLLIGAIQADKNSPKGSMRTAFGLAVLSCLQYQILFMVPAFFATLLVAGWVRGQQKKWELLKHVILGVTIYALLMCPVYGIFLRRHLGRGINWLSAGPHGEFQFSWASTASWPANLLYTARFFLENAFLVFRTHTAFLPETSPLFIPSSIFLAGLAWAGVWFLGRSRVFKERMLGFFLVLYAATWVALILQKEIALGPSRHTLILLPSVVLLVPVGWIGIRNGLQERLRLKTVAEHGHWGIIGAMVLLFLLSFPGMVRQRQDPFDEATIEAVLARYDVDTVIETSGTLNVGLMRRITRTYNFLGTYQKHGVLEHAFKDRGNPLYQKVALIGQTRRLTPGLFEEVRSQVNQHPQLQQNRAFYWRYHLRDYRVVHEEEKPSSVEIEFSSRTVPSNPNGFFFYVLELNPGIIQKGTPIEPGIVTDH